MGSERLIDQLMAPYDEDDDDVSDLSDLASPVVRPQDRSGHIFDPPSSPLRLPIIKGPRPPSGKDLHVLHSVSQSVRSRRRRPSAILDGGDALERAASRLDPTAFERQNNGIEEKSPFFQDDRSLAVPSKGDDPTDCLSSEVQMATLGDHAGQGHETSSLSSSDGTCACRSSADSERGGNDSQTDASTSSSLSASDMTSSSNNTEDTPATCLSADYRPVITSTPITAIEEEFIGSFSSNEGDARLHDEGQRVFDEAFGKAVVFLHSTTPPETPSSASQPSAAAQVSQSPVQQEQRPTVLLGQGDAQITTSDDSFETIDSTAQPSRSNRLEARLPAIDSRFKVRDRRKTRDENSLARIPAITVSSGAESDSIKLDLHDRRRSKLRPLRLSVMSDAASEYSQASADLPSNVTSESPHQAESDVSLDSAIDLTVAESNLQAQRIKSTYGNTLQDHSQPQRPPRDPRRTPSDASMAVERSSSDSFAEASSRPQTRAQILDDSLKRSLVGIEGQASSPSNMKAVRSTPRGFDVTTKLRRLRLMGEDIPSYEISQIPEDVDQDGPRARSFSSSSSGRRTRQSFDREPADVHPAPRRLATADSSGPHPLRHRPSGTIKAKLTTWLEQANASQGRGKAVGLLREATTKLSVPNIQRIRPGTADGKMGRSVTSLSTYATDDRDMSDDQCFHQSCESLHVDACHARQPALRLPRVARDFFEGHKTSCNASQPSNGLHGLLSRSLDDRTNFMRRHRRSDETAGTGGKALGTHHPLQRCKSVDLPSQPNERDCSYLGLGVWEASIGQNAVGTSEGGVSVRPSTSTRHYRAPAVDDGAIDLTPQRSMDHEVSRGRRQHSRAAVDELIMIEDDSHLESQDRQDFLYPVPRQYVKDHPQRSTTKGVSGPHRTPKRLNARIEPSFLFISKTSPSSSRRSSSIGRQRQEHSSRRNHHPSRQGELLAIGAGWRQS